MDTNKNRIFWGAFVVYNAHGKLIEKGEIYSPNEEFPENAIMRIAKRHDKNHLVKFLPGVRCMRAE